MTLGRPNTAPALCALLGLAAFVAPVPAQEAPATDDSSRVTRDGRRTTLEYELPASTRQLNMALPPSTRCTADISLSYIQKDTLASVEGSLGNGVCAASGGEYTLAISIRDDKGEMQTLEFTEAWQRTDDQPVVLEGEYPIGANVDLMRVRTRRVTCTCAEAPAAPAE